MMDMGISQTIMQRKSVRKYSTKSLSVAILKEIEAYIDKVNQQNKGIFRMMLLDGTMAKEGKMGTLFGMVRLNAPYGIVLIGQQDQAARAGYEGEKIVLELTKKGLGTCWLGTYSKEALNQSCHLTTEEQTFCVIALGWPYDGGFFNTTFRNMVGAHKRKAIEEIVFDNKGGGLKAEDFRDMPVLKEVIEAAIKAPSANNLQPWRIIMDGKQLEIYYQSNFRLDSGIFMAHLILMLQEKGLQFNWQERTMKETQSKWIHLGNIELI